MSERASRYETRLCREGTQSGPDHNCGDCIDDCIAAQRLVYAATFAAERSFSIMIIPYYTYAADPKTNRY